MKPYELKTLTDLVRADIQTLGFDQADHRLSRRTRSYIGYRLPVDEGNLVRWLKKEKMPSKFEDDWDRIRPHLDRCAEMAKEDPESRRLVLFNDKDYHIHAQCFTQLHFLKDGSDEENRYVLVVTQRSGDLAKLDQDLIFFGNIASRWEKAAKTKVRRFVINYGHIHYQL